MLQVESVSQHIGKRRILQDISFSVSAGSIVGLVGLNGAGKTTLIKRMLNLVYGSQGRLLIHGHDSDLPKSREGLFFLPEHFLPPRNLKGREVLRLLVQPYGINPDHETMEAVAKNLGMRSEVLTHAIKTYSKGMAQKIGLMAALLSERPLLILDEPMSGLDPEARALLRVALLAYRDAQKDKRAIFFSSHILSDVERLCDTLLVIHEGRLLYQGTTENFKRQYQATDVEHAFLQAIDVPAVA